MNTRNETITRHDVEFEGGYRMVAFKSPNSRSRKPWHVSIFGRGGSEIAHERFKTHDAAVRHAVFLLTHVLDIGPVVIVSETKS